MRAGVSKFFACTENEQTVKLRDINIIEKYSDAGKSGKNAEHRPAFNQMMDDIRSRKDHVKYVLVLSHRGDGDDSGVC